ncbi:uncharacterized protein LOC110650537 [Hevea brasiliensis]|uniref:uncharacterized protein LOC110650537 n=1 Tax=Hevea brasiliensis TaxID=3981 RepID=UPI0025F99FCA|nr:uncharacterized protein LOC110650537 [Hevea brasiliensis]XP_057999636.1 uncharacterized protein LOC110650537 [Hevea brasiliensis]
MNPFLFASGNIGANQGSFLMVILSQPISLAPLGSDRMLLVTHGRMSLHLLVTSTSRNLWIKWRLWWLLLLLMLLRTHRMTIHKRSQSMSIAYPWILWVERRSNACTVWALMLQLCTQTHSAALPLPAGQLR